MEENHPPQTHVSSSPRVFLLHRDADDTTSDLTYVEPPATIAQVGGKGLSLIRHASHKAFPVPTGFVLAVSFFEPWMQQIQASKQWNDFEKQAATATNSSGVTKEHCDAIKEQCSKLNLTPTQRSDLETSIQAVFKLDAATKQIFVAVRSSSPEEDLAKTSFAGGYETTLGVPLQYQDLNDLLRAILHSFASVFDHRVVQYKIQNQMSLLSPKIAVVVQQQIDSDKSGVAFSLNPLNNCYDEAVISSNFGLGESVVSGVVTPDTFVVDKIRREILSKQVASNKETVFRLGPSGGMVEESNETDRKHDPSEPTLTDDEIFMVADLVTQVEEYMGVPADIEWAMDGGSNNKKLYLLQARPITTYLPLFPEMMTIPGAPKKLYVDFIVISQGFTTPFSPLGLDIWRHLLCVAKPQFTHGPDGHLLYIHGREFLQVSHILGAPGGQTFLQKFFSVIGGSLLRTFNAIDFNEYRPTKVVPKNRWLIWTSLKNVLILLPSIIRSLWNPHNCMDDFLAKSDRFIELYGMNGSEDHASDVPPLFAEQVNQVFSALDDILWSIAGIVVSVYSMNRLSNLFSDNSDAKDLLAALNMDLKGNPTSEMGHAMLHLASFPEFEETKTAEDFVQKVEAETYSMDFLDAYKDFIRRFGCRAIKEIDIATPRNYETPHLLFQQLKQIDVHNNQILSVQDRKLKAREKLLEIATRAGKQATFLYYADVLSRTGGYREHPKYLFTVLVAYLRRRVLELSRDFVRQGRLDDVGQIFDLTVDQITQAQRDPDANLRAMAQSNKASYASSDYDWPEVINSRGKILRAPPMVAEDGCLCGDPISPGVIEGRAKVLRSPYEKPLERGEILVTKATEPSWTPIFVNAAAVVLEVGGPLQHGAIIAREYGIPCVSGVDRAMQRIRDGDLLQVDGTNGIIRFL